MDSLDVLSSKAEAVVNQTLRVIDIFVGMGRLESILTQVGRLASPLQIPLHEFNSRNQAVSDFGEVLMPLEVGHDAPRGNLIGFFIQYLPMSLIHVHSCVIPVRHRLEGFVIIIEGGLCEYVHDVRHRVDGGPHGVGGDVSVVEILYPLW